MGIRQNQYGVLLLNMGGPGSPDEVEDYIFQLLADPDMVRMPLAPLLQKPLARLVARRRAPRVRARYRLIGGCSPIAEATENQAEAVSVCSQLPVEFAMRYTPPSAAEAAAELLQQGVTRLVAIPPTPILNRVDALGDQGP
jgi:ferrochelatase